MINDMPVIDGIVHAYNLLEENYAYDAGPVIARNLASILRSNVAETGQAVPDSADFNQDITIEDIARVAFLESGTDLATYHVLPLGAFKDGLCSVEKAVEANRRWPNRFIFYAGVDPLKGKAAVDDLQRQYDALEGNVVGVKTYPHSWVTGKPQGWHMDDGRVAYPIWEKASELGLKIASCHKATPLGPVEMEYYKTSDIDRAAMDFPHLNFEIVHGGQSFVEETAWQLMRFPNIYVNLETTTRILQYNPRRWERIMAAFFTLPHMTDRIVWGTGGFVIVHPQKVLDLFLDFRFRHETLESDEGLEQVTEATQRKVLAENYAAMTGIDLSARLAAIQGDEFDVARRVQTGTPVPFSTSPTVASLMKSEPLVSAP